MAKLKPLSKKKVIRILEKHGFEMVRSNKHITFKKSIGNKVLTTWIPHHSDVSVFVIGYIIKQTEIPRSEFES